MDYISTLKELTTRSAVSGREEGLSVYIKGLFKEYCDTVEVDKFYNVTGIMKGTGGGKKVMVTAHYDEIGMLVKSIDESGFIKISGVGGIDGKILLAHEVTIHGKRDIPGVIGAKPPHLLKPEEAKHAVKGEDLYIDTGMKATALKELLSIGDVITLKTAAAVLQGGKVSSKSIDNRASVISLLEMMRQLSIVKHKTDVYFVATTQEEVGAVSAKMASYSVKPDAAIVIDACHGEMPECSKDVTYGLGKGPAVGIGPVLQRKLSRKVIDIAKEENIPHQIDVEPGSTGTEAWVTQIAGSGIPTILLSIPVRYMHTAVETVNMDDIKNSGKLAAAFVIRAEAEMEELLCY